MQHVLLRKMKYLLAVSFVFAAFAGAFAQGFNVTGKVVDEKGEGLPGVTVLQKGAPATGAGTGIDGSFSLTVSESNATLVFTYVGYKRQEVPLGGRTAINVSLVPDDKALEEVVVIGYATVNRRDLTGSVSSVSSKQLADIPINSAAEALAGRLAGVQVTGSEGTPNAEVQIRVRGGGSITQDNAPLYVVDGIQVENALSVLSPQDIETIDVLKDASATAIYGARGANGVVIITTKGGKEMKTTVSYNGLTGIRRLANKLDLMNPYDFVRYQYERSRGGTTSETNFRNTYGTFQDIELYRDAPFVDWQDEVFGRDAVMQTHNVSIAGGTAVTKFSLSLTSNKEEGIMLGSDFDRKLVNFRFDHNISKAVRTGFNVRYNNTVVNGAGTATEGSSSVNRLRHSVKYRPFLTPGQGIADYDADYAEETNANSLALVNPILLTDAEYKRNIGNLINLNGYANFDLNKYLSFKTTVGVDINNNRINAFNDSITSISRLQGSGQPIASIDTRTRNILNNSNVLTFSNRKSKSPFSERHNIDFLLGHEIYEVTNRSYYIENRLFPLGTSVDIALGNMALGTPQIPRSNEVKSTLLSFFSRANYAFDDKYLVTLTMRADGSSKFSQNNKWGYFPSASFAWRMLNENFMEGFRTKLDDLKFRVSYGTAGNNRIDDFRYRTLFEANTFYGLNNTQTTAFRTTELGNEHLKWETTISKNIGLDLAFLNNRVQVTVDAYSNNTRDLLVYALIPPSSGYPAQFQNVASTSNRGVEFQLTGVPVATSDFNWTTSFNLSFNRNRVEAYSGYQNEATFQSGWAGSNAPHDYAVIVGKPVGTIWGLVSDGFYTLDDFNYENGVYTLREGVANNRSVTALNPQPGVIKYRDLNGDGIVDDKDRTAIGDANPDFFGGINNQVRFKNFDMSVFVNFQYGNDVLNANKLEFSSGYTPNSNLLSIMNDRWTNVNSEGVVVTSPEELAALNQNATLWTPLTTSTSFYVNSWAVEDASFIRINNITMGYTLPAHLLDRAKISKLRVYGTVNNLKVFTNYSGYDPEVNTRRASPVTAGVDYAAYPRSRAFILGVNLTI